MRIVRIIFVRTKYEELFKQKMQTEKYKTNNLEIILEKILEALLFSIFLNFKTCHHENINCLTYKYFRLLI